MLRIPIFEKINGYVDEENDEHAVIISHLNRLLNTRRGSSLSDPDYGIPDLNDLLGQMPRSCHSIARIFEDCIRKYETRIEVYQVRANKSVGTDKINFEIIASVKSRNISIHRSLWSMKAFVDGLGYVRVL